METNQGELANPPIVRFSIGTEDTGFFSVNQWPSIHDDNYGSDPTFKRCWPL